ncbi:MAG: two-component regulator propeller domain-containing protein [Acidobacteriota bacterium]
MYIKSRHWSLRFLTLSVYIVVGLSTLAKAQEYGFDTWTTANGLPQNTVTGVAQTPDGYLWLSTFDGLARFDGVRFTIFDKGNTKGILNNRFSGIFVDKDGAVWAAAENGVVTVYRNGAFASYQPPETFGSSIAIVSDGNGNAVIEGADRFYYLRDGKFIPVSDQKEKGVKRFYYGKSGAKWTFERNKVTWQKAGQTTNYALSQPSEYLTLVNSLLAYEDNQGALWIRFKEKLCRLADGKVTTLTKNEIPALKELNLQTIFDDAEGSIWFVFGTANLDAPVNGQLVRFKDGQFTSYNSGKSVPAGPGITDREGNFWLATTTGLRRLRRQLITSLSVKDGLNRNEVYPLLQTSKGDIFIGTVQGVNRYSDGKITNLRLKYTAGFPLYMRGLWEDTSARVWLGYQGEGGFGRFEEPSSVRRIGKNDIPNGATDFASDQAGNIWIATEEGLYKYKDDNEIAHYTVKDGLLNDKIITVHFDRNGSLWLGTFDGLSQFKDGKFFNFGDVENSPRGFVRAIYEDAEGVLWFGTYGDGLVRYKDGKFFNYRVEHGLFNNGVFAILEDGRGNFWMSSNRGIHRVSRQELNEFADGKIPKLNSVSYDEKDGMLNAECNGGRIPSAIKTRDGKLWFATMGGVAIIDPEAEKINPHPPPVVIENISIDRKSVDPNHFQSAIRHPQSAIELSPGQSNLEIHYTGLSLIKSEQIKFKYKLEGFEENWVEAGRERIANYSYLPHGEYRFRVIAANANGVWNTDGAMVKIIVHPYFYQTWWFRVLAALAVALITGLIYYNRVSHLRTIAETKTAFSRQLIESQEAERKRIAAELHDGLGQSLVIIKNRAMLGIKKGDDKARVAKELDRISESATLALDEVREITNNLRPQLLDRLGLTKALISMCKKISGVVEVECEVASIDNLFNESEEISFYRIVQESLNNIIKHANASSASVKIKRTESRIMITIEDNGKGFEVENIKSGGLGLVGLRERAQLLNGEFSIQSKIGKGTSIQVEIRLV